MNAVELRNEKRYYGCIPCNILIAGDVCHSVIINTSLHGVGIIVDGRIFDDIEDSQEVLIQPLIDLRPCGVKVKYSYVREINDDQIYYYGLRVLKSDREWTKYITNLMTEERNKLNKMPHKELLD